MTNQSPECDHRSTEKGDMTDQAPELLPMEALPLSIGFAVEYLDGVMSAEQAEIQRMWKIVRAHMLIRPTPSERPAPQVREALIERFVKELRKWWSFDDGQRHTHTWHSREDFIERELPKLIAALTPVVAREPVAWRWRWKNPTDEYWRHSAMHPGEDVVEIEPLYTSPPPASAVREALEIGANVTLPDTYQWSKANIQKFNFGRDRAVESIRAALSIKGA